MGKIIKKRPKPVATLPKIKKVRLAIDCTPEERQKIKMLAAYNHVTIANLLLSAVLKSECNASHIPNDETAKALRESEKGEGNTEHATVEEMFKFLGI